MFFIPWIICRLLLLLRNWHLLMDEQIKVRQTIFSRGGLWQCIFTNCFKVQPDIWEISLSSHILFPSLQRFVSFLLFHPGPHHSHQGCRIWWVLKFVPILWCRWHRELISPSPFQSFIIHDYLHAQLITIPHSVVFMMTKQFYDC